MEKVRGREKEKEKEKTVISSRRLFQVTPAQLAQVAAEAAANTSHLAHAAPSSALALQGAQYPPANPGQQSIQDLKSAAAEAQRAVAKAEQGIKLEPGVAADAPTYGAASAFKGKGGKAHGKGKSKALANFNQGPNPRPPPGWDDKKGDWTCKHCNGFNYKSKSFCFHCNAPKGAA